MPSGASERAGDERSVRILQVVTDRERRGAQTFAIELANGLAGLGASVATVALTDGERPSLDIDVLGQTRRGMRTLLALRRRARTADVVVAHGSTTLTACAIALVGTRVPFVYRQISDPRYWAPSWLKRVRVAVLLRRAEKVVVLTDAIGASYGEYYRLPSSKFTTIRNGVPGNSYREATEDERQRARASFGLAMDQTVIVCVGALAPEKAIDTLIRSLLALPRSAVLLVAGSGPELPRLQQCAAGVGAHRVVFAGELEDPLRAYHAADIVALASRSEAMPAVLIEGGLCGLPVVATSVGAVGDIVDDETTGLLVPVENQAALDRALERLVSDSDMRNVLGSAARDRCSRFTVDAVAADWLAALRGAVARHDAP